ncbi:MAG: M81 family metallopeptidase [Roseiarcus sp.]
MRVAVGGFLHETNTFAEAHTTYEDFATPDAWPGVIRADEIAPAVRGLNLPVAGFLAQAEALGFDVVPTIWASAAPSGVVTRSAFEAIVGELVERLLAAGRVDAVFLDLHGAMVCEHVADGEGEILRRVREAVGAETKIVVALDFHANITRLMVDAADLLATYRTYPHVDMEETGRRAAALLAGASSRPLKAFRKLPFLIPLHWQSTLAEPMASLMAIVEAEERLPGVTSVALAAGFSLADFDECGPAIVVYGDDRKAVDASADRLERSFLDREPAFAGELLEPSEAIRRALSVDGAVLLADTQDNPGAGATSDSVGILRAMIEARVPDGVVAVICDPEAAAAAHAAGEGADIHIALGAKSARSTEESVVGTFHVERLGDGNFDATGPFYSGCRMQLGPMAQLRIGGVRIVVSSRRQQAADRAMLRHVGIDPARHKIIALKSSVHFRADFAPLAKQILIVVAPGENIADPERLGYSRLRPGVRIQPLGRPFEPRQGER